jgi:hypothetical protein
VLDRATDVAEGSDFAPLTPWKAVVAGDKANIGRLYPLTPPAQAKTPAGDSTDPAEEAAFWAGISAKGLAKFDPKLMEILEPQDGVVLLVLRVEFTSGKNPAEDDVVRSWRKPTTKNQS